MDKKEYQRPELTVAHAETHSMLATSGGSTGATGEDVPWAAKQANMDENWNLWNEE